MCSTQFRNLRNLEIVQIPKLRGTYACTKLQVYVLCASMSKPISCCRQAHTHSLVVYTFKSWPYGHTENSILQTDIRMSPT